MSDPEAISYYVPPTAIRAEWVVISAYAAVSQWHSAKALLNSHRIDVLMRTDSAGQSLLLVPATEAQWAISLLGPAKEEVQVERYKGFPVVQGESPPLAADPWPGLPVAEGSPASAGPVQRAMPPERTGLSDSQHRLYTAVIVLLWGLLAIVALGMLAIYFNLAD